MVEFCYVVERIEWDENGETRQFWADRDICCAFKDYDKARAYVESNASGCPFPLKWLGDRLYIGTVENPDKSREG